ncbi:MAG: 50S ribosomal protein L1 [Candidatus Moranbacteria bacterium GW2011_GWE2_35_2-]|nr:MAG: 50S ribosomal protein L1 [Candidatus Moranbacteria bacterium GW2011_GWE2_35_2-]KKQ22090.1 MAG: 50S ribosomal protein L1 [Candidatus Moranbacteria bacterium GW2011_GWF2_37_11]KKQ29157.1 MAG: 50S ribosomal protein L1 [Candidatus Moranbacteria bacterium GW2011_GWD1_37_17]KKQ31142.1 MAG: 50S ribosomal protein L1 [Candidatus Moranbacteria bacterium GW2011_GWE1_37_24]KKQ47392.1 MAG: 50S ribosomal protein L1 [Candidatus Moranbacteria bacterium GW2011_GWD2_37_9]HBO16460.1 50S ribosomal protein
MKRGKKYLAGVGKIEKNKIYSVSEAVRLVKENKIARFDESVEIHIRMDIDPKKGDQQVRGATVLPHGTGKIKKIAVATTIRIDEAKKSGADIVGAEDLIEKIKGGKIEFDILVATPEMMPKLAPIAKILGPKGLMPSPKAETVTDKIAETVEMLKKGKVNFKNDNTGNLHQVIGKVSFDEKKLEENLISFVNALQKSKPIGVKGKFIIGISVCSTMGPAVKISL